jgi:hypothetical protein
VTLEDRVRDVLSRLALLAEGATVNLDPDRTSHGAPESKVPNGVSLRSSDKPPDKRKVSLHEWHSWHFAKAQAEDNREKIASLILVAEMDYNEFRFRVAKRVDLRSGELVENDPQDPGASERANAARVADWYEGVPVLVVAILEEQTEGWVKKARRQNDRDSVSGRPRAEFLGWDEERRRLEVKRLAAQDKGAKAIAARLGVDKNTVKRYMPVEAAAA